MNPEAINTAMGIAGAVACLGLSATGSAFGTGYAATAAMGAWKKCYVQNKPAPFILLGLVGAPITQTLYGMILMFVMFGKAAVGMPLLILGIFSGLGIGVSALFQGVPRGRLRRAGRDRSGPHQLLRRARRRRDRCDFHDGLHADRCVPDQSIALSVHRNVDETIPIPMLWEGRASARPWASRRLPLPFHYLNVER